MNKFITHSTGLALTFILASCSLIEPTEVENPNVGEDTYLASDRAMDIWVNGAEKAFATTIAKFCLHTEIISDNYFNNYTRESKVFDKPELKNTDPDIADLQRLVANLRESADYGINTVSQHDQHTTAEHLFKLHTMKAYAFLLAGENFRALPTTVGGNPLPANEQLQLAKTTLDKALTYANNNHEKALVHTLKARVYYVMGKAQNAIEESKLALQNSNDFIEQVTFDGKNNVTNNMQDVIWKTMYQPLPRLDFLDPKYFQLKSTDECPISIAKAEENYLILAEAYLSQGQSQQAKRELNQLLQLVAKRPVQQQLNDQLEGRYNGGFKNYPDAADYRVAASLKDPYRSGLVLNRKSPHLIQVPTVSGTSVTAEMIDVCKDNDALLELIYLMRQEIFLAEGRRMSDLGIRLPISDVEIAHTPAAKTYSEPLIPKFIPLEQGMDNFDIDTEKRLVTIHYNMNHLIVINKNRPEVAPFFTTSSSKGK